ncbi:3 beta-hydroxysteroid dehydrogenase type 7 [Daldinia childiae]|uniref:3 beta-hydroxysteroid dehydrogenase type 7 n=1 Tax=Daldinia childiae TaxID=326645 RepID=UPI001445EEAF|nr:3 beta-hydroxysteroid dehydrogenase type 7 [Daldinia childiae]KAF3066526.1 3 beta-hydroxysteroid dehydrogenase type 7 [Daldinia childiae]
MDATGKQTLYAAIATFLVIGIAWIWKLNSTLKQTPPEVLAISPHRWTEQEIKDTYRRIEANPIDWAKQLPPQLNRRYIVTGGCGGVGGQIVLHLLARGQSPESIRIIDFQKPVRSDMTTGSAALVDFAQADITSPPATSAAFNKPWPKSVAHLPLTVFHTAAIIQASERSLKTYERIKRVNIDGVQNVLDASKQAGATVFVSTSSASVAYTPVRYWNNPFQRWPENYWQLLDDSDFDRPLRPHAQFFSNYAHAKATAERLISEANNSGFRTGIVRPGNGIYGSSHGDQIIGLCLRAANVVPPAEARPPRLTFGVEMEFVVPWLPEGVDDVLEHIKGLPPIFRIKEEPKDGDIPAVIYKMIKALFEKHNLPANIKTYTYKTDFIKGILGNYNHWGVTEDVTVNEPVEAKTFDWVKKFGWVGVEVQTPVEPDIPAAFEVLNYARQLLISSYRCRVNHSCGLHVHVGNGAEYFPLDSLRRIASLVFATEHLLTTLNHPWRVVNWNCRTLRDRSNLSNRLDGQAMSPGPTHETGSGRDCVRYLATEVRHGEEPISWREENRSNKYVDAFDENRNKAGFQPFQPKMEPKAGEAAPKKKRIKAKAKNAGGKEEEDQVIKASSDPFIRPIKPSKPVRTRNIPRIARTRYTDEQLEDINEKTRDWGCSGLEVDGPNSHRAPDPGVFAGVQQIYQSVSSCEIAHLMYPRGGAMVNFRHYACDSFMHRNSGRTIEFRGAEGSLSSWVVVWAKICVGLIKFAIRSPYYEFTRVLENCDISTDEDGVYDCIDLLDDLGLYAEAEAAEKGSRRIKRNGVSSTWSRREGG